MLNYKEFLTFLVCGGLAAMINIGSRWLLSLVMSYIPAIIIAYGFGLVSGFLLFKNVAFKSSPGNSARRQIFFYGLVNLFGVIQIVIVSVALANHLFPLLKMDFYPQDIAHMIGVGSVAITSYFGHKRFTFR